MIYNFLKHTLRYFYLLILLFGIGLSQYVNAQVWGKPTNFGNSNYHSRSFESTFFVSATKGWAVGDNNTIITTNDGGITWTDQVLS